MVVGKVMIREIKVRIYVSSLNFIQALALGSVSKSSTMCSRQTFRQIFDMHVAGDGKSGCSATLQCTTHQTYCESRL